MKITKLGHCCLLIETKGKKILTDPGSYSDKQNSVTDIDIILITHEHPDHLHIESLKTVLRNNPQAKVITNKGVGKILKKESMPHELLLHLQSTEVDGVLLEGYGEKHADIYETITPVENTGYFIDNRFFYPGDALYNPGKSVEILALPVAGPWMKIGEAIDYAKEIKPKKCFPVHDGMFKEGRLGPVHRLPQQELPLIGIEFVPMVEGDIIDF